MKIRATIRKHWKKGLVVFFGLFMSYSQSLLWFYIGFWLARWTYGLKIIRVKKGSNTQPLPSKSEELTIE